MVYRIALFGCLFSRFCTTARASDVVPSTVQMPGTQPEEVSSLQTANRCDNCHGGYDRLAEPAHLWNGSMMAHAAADPLFWATVAVAEQDFDGAGDLCLRCHTPNGWLSGRSTPTDGSSLSASSDSDGVECDLCHQLTDPLAQAPQPVGVQNPPFVAITAGEGHYGSAQYVMYGGNEKLGPYGDAEARHQWIQSAYYRSSDLCRTCHDVSNPVVGNVANQPAGTAHESFHFVLNNVILSDNRIPPWRLNRETARQRNALPVPSDKYGNPGATGVYEHFDLVPLNPPPLAQSADIELLYQPTSWEYIQFLYLANDGESAFLGAAGANLLDAWLTAGDATTRMAAPYAMASTTHVVPEPGQLLMFCAGVAFLLTACRSRIAA